MQMSGVSNSNELGNVEKKRAAIFPRRQCLPRRYAIAFMMFILFINLVWKSSNTNFAFEDAIINENAHEIYPSLSNMTFLSLFYLQQASAFVSVIVQIPTGLLLLYLSSYKLLSATVFCLSVLNVLTNLTLNGHMYLFVSCSLLKELLTKTMDITVFCFWKDWAPPTERSRLLIISFYATFLHVTITSGFVMIPISPVTTFTITGIIGIIWGIFWITTFFDQPGNDTFISEEELTYIQNNIPPMVQRETKISEVPWKSILTSKPTFVLCFLFFELNVFVQGTFPNIILLSYLSGNVWQKMVLIILLLGTVFLISSSLLFDYLTTKYRNYSSVIRKRFICGAFLVKGVLMLCSLVTNKIRLHLNAVAALITLISIPGFFSLPLDISQGFIPVVGSIIFTFHYLGRVFFCYFVAFVPIKSEFWYDLVNTIQALIAAGLYFRWGSDEEQPWSFIVCKRSKCDSKSYPKIENIDCLNLVSTQA